MTDWVRKYVCDYCAGTLLVRLDDRPKVRLVIDGCQYVVCSDECRRKMREMHENPDMLLASAKLSSRHTRNIL